jgi:multidrug transporter EmrE-like cation transporter
MKLAALVIAYALGMAGTNLLLKLAAEASGTRWWLWFVLANTVGFTCVVVMPFALKLAPSNIVYALCIGLGFTLLQIIAWVIFREPLSAAQWAGVACVAAGLVLLQMKG